MRNFLAFSIGNYFHRQVIMHCGSKIPEKSSAFEKTEA